MFSTKNSVVVIDEHEVMQITKDIAEVFTKYFPNLTAYAISDIPGEDHVYAVDENRKPMFDLLVSSSRKFVFLWYYIHPTKGIEMVEAMKQLALSQEKDFVVKFPNIPKKATGYPTIVRYGKKPAGKALMKFIVKAGNPQLEDKVFSEENLNTYRSYDWHTVPNAMQRILAKAKEMAKERLKKHPEKEKNILGYCLYAGCAYHKRYPHLGFGMRDIDVQVFFSPEWFTNTRCAFTRNCGIEEFGRPEYFRGNTRWLDLMWNSFHTSTGNFKNDVVTYINEMRHKSDRWATISQRPMIDLTTEKTIYVPRWIQKLEKVIEL